MQRRDFVTGYYESTFTKKVMNQPNYETSFTKKKTVNQDQNNRDKFMEKVEVWVCKICDKDYASKGSLNRHISTAHEQPRAVVPAPSRAVQQRGQPGFLCRHCGGEYSTQGNLNRHVSTVHEKPRANIAVSNSTKLVQKNKTNVTINVYNPVVNNNRFGNW